MANFFPKWTNWISIKLIVIIVTLKVTVAMGVAYYFTPKYTRVGYMPTQPVAFDHTIHVEQLGMDCRYCHTHVENSDHSNIPSTQVCMTCHTNIQAQNPKLQPVRDSYESGDPIKWVRIHKAPDYAYFDHSIHVNSGVSCYSCHGKVNEMETVWQHESQSMGWCLECHREPEKHLREKENVFDLNWHAASSKEQYETGKKLKEAWEINPPENCQACHR